MTDDNFVIETADNFDRTIDYAVELTLALIRERGVSVTDAPGVLRTMYAAVREAAGPPVPVVPEITRPTRRQIADSVQADHLISFEDGKRYKTLKRHLALLGMTPTQYRAKWSLPDDYPIVAPSYSALRSELAKATGLGRK